MGSLLLILKQCLALKQARKKYQFSLSVRTDRYQYMYHISKVSLMLSNDYYWYQILDCRKMLRSDEEINGLTNMWPGRGCVGPSLYETGRRTPVVIWREWATTWSVDGDCFASLTNYWRNHGFLALCKVDFCFRWWHLFSLQEQTQNCFYVKQARVFVLEGSSLPKWVSVRDKTERKDLILLLDTNKFLNNQWQFYWREHFIIKLLVHHSNWKLLAQNNITQLHGILIERSLIQIYGEILVNFTFIN